MINEGQAVYRRKDLAVLLHVNVSTIDRMVKDNRLPMPEKLGSRIVFWPKKKIDSWVQNPNNRLMGD